MKYQNKKEYYFPLGLLMVIIIFIFDYFGLSIHLENIFGSAVKPVSIFSTQLVGSFEKPFFVVRKSINSARKVQMLETRYSESLAQLSDLAELEKENQDLRNVLENSDRQARDIIITSPVVSHVGPSIGVGKKDGVEIGDLIFVAQTLVGRVSDVSDNYSRVHLVYQKDFVPLVAETSDGIKGLIKGDGKRVIFTEVISGDNPVVESRINTVGQIGVDRGLFIGQIGKEISQPSDSVKSYSVTQYADFYQAHVVEIYK
jgi:cell shape-determining protein MreC